MSRTISARSVSSLVGDFARDPAYVGLAEGLRAVIADGRIPAGTRLPSERDLTSELGVSRTTVTRAYAELRDRGYLHSRQGAGSVAALPDGRSRTADVLLPASDLGAGEADLSCAAPAPTPGILAAYQRAMAALPDFLCGTGYYPTGLPVLRDEIAAWFTRRGLPTSPDQIVVVPGAQAGVAAAAQVLVRPGTRVLVESPTYPNCATTFRRAGARMFSTHVARVDPGVDELVHMVAKVRPEIAYLIPDFHNPTGRLMSSDERQQVAHALRKAGTVAIIDESMVEIALDGPVPEPYAVHDPTAITVGSLSKPFWGGLRIGWARLPAKMLPEYVAARMTLDLGVPLLEQLTGLELLRGGDTALAHRLAQLRSSREAGLAALGEHLPDWKVRRPAGGLSLWCELPEARSTDLYPHAKHAGVRIVPGPAFAPEGGLDRFVRIPFALAPEVLQSAIPRLAEAWQQTLTGRRRTSSQPEPTLVA